MQKVLKLDKTLLSVGQTDDMDGVVFKRVR